MVPSCTEGGVLGILPGVMGAIQATEVIQLIQEVGNPLIGRLLLFNALDMRTREVQTLKDPECPICGENPTIHELIDYEQFCGVSIEPHADELDEEWLIQPDELAATLNNGSGVVLIDVRNPPEWEICKLPTAQLIPEPELPSKINDLNKTDNIVLYCRTGIRSARALKMLRIAGFERVRNLVGGIHAWAEKVDPSFPKY
jgi:adenylyltransferase/sulfurtransferase